MRNPGQPCCITHHKWCPMIWKPMGANGKYLATGTEDPVLQMDWQWDHVTFHVRETYAKELGGLSGRGKYCFKSSALFLLTSPLRPDSSPVLLWMLQFQNFSGKNKLLLCCIFPFLHSLSRGIIWKGLVFPIWWGILLFYKCVHVLHVKHWSKRFTNITHLIFITPYEDSTLSSTTFQVRILKCRDFI